MRLLLYLCFIFVCNFTKAQTENIKVRFLGIGGSYNYTFKSREECNSYDLVESKTYIIHFNYQFNRKHFYWINRSGLYYNKIHELERDCSGTRGHPNPWDIIYPITETSFDRKFINILFQSYPGISFGKKLKFYLAGGVSPEITINYQNFKNQEALYREYDTSHILINKYTVNTRIKSNKPLFGFNFGTGIESGFDINLSESHSLRIYTNLRWTLYSYLLQSLDWKGDYAFGFDFMWKLKT